MSRLFNVALTDSTSRELQHSRITGPVTPTQRHLTLFKHYSQLGLIFMINPFDSIDQRTEEKNMKNLEY